MADNKLELVVEVDANRANASIKSVNASLSSMEASAAKTARGASAGIDGMTAAMVKGATAGNLLADAIKSALSWAKEFTVGSVMMAAQNAKAEASLKALAKAHGAGAEVAARQVAAIEDIGYEYTEAAHAVQRLIVADLELSKATGLAKLAKDAAAVQNIAAGEALESIVMAIESGASRGLRTLGLFVDFQRDAQIAQLQLGRALTETEEKQVRYNAVMREGTKIQGAHASASQTAEGQLIDLRREFNNLREDIGAKFQDDLRALIGNLRGLVGWLRENTDLLSKFGQTAVWVAGVLATYGLATKIMDLAKAIAALNLASMNPYAILAVGVAGAGFAVYSQWKNTRDQLQDRFDERRRNALRDDLMSGRTSVDALRKQGMTDDQVRELVSGTRRFPGEQQFAYEGPRLTVKTSPEPDLEALKRTAEIRKRQLEVERESARAIEEARRRNLTGFARDTAEVQEQIRKWTTYVDEHGNEQRIGLTRKAWENVIGELRERLANWQKEVQETNRKNLTEYLAAEEEAARRRLEIESHLFSQRLAYNEEIVRQEIDSVRELMEFEAQRAGFERDARLRQLEGLDARTIEQKVAVERQKAEIEIAYLEKVHEVKQRLFDLDTSMAALEIENRMKAANYQADAITARIAEFTQARDRIRQQMQETTDEAMNAARENAAIRQAQLVRDHNQRIFDSLKQQAGGVFDALLTKSQSVWQAIGNSLKTALLTAIKDVVTSRVAAMLMQLFGGARVSMEGGGASSGGTLGRLGGLLGVGAVPVFGGGGMVPGLGGFGIPGAPGGTGGFAGQVSMGGSSGATGAPWASLGATGANYLASLKSFLGIGGSVQLGPGMATTWQAATMGQKFSSIGKSNAALMAGAMLAFDGLRRGGFMGMAETTAGGAMVGFKYGGPLGAAIGAGVGAVAGLVRLFVKGAQEKAREKIKATYGVDIRDKGVLRQIVDIAKQGFGGNLDMAIRSQQIRDLVELYAMSTGQSTSGLPSAMRPVSLLQQGGGIFQSSSGGMSTFDRIGASSGTIEVHVHNQLPADQVGSYMEGKIVTTITKVPRAVQGAAIQATRSNAGRREMAALQLSPGLVVS